MENKHSLKWMAIGALLLCSSLFGATVEENWNDFLHYTATANFDLAESYANQIIESQPDPTELLSLAEENEPGYRLLLKMHADSDQLREVSGKILDLIEQGRYIRRTDPKIIVQEIKRLSSNLRGKIAAEERLKNAGEYAIPYMLAVLADESRQNEFSYITDALPKIGRSAIRPLVAALQMEEVAVKLEVIRALGKIGYYEPLPYLKLIVDRDSSELLKTQAINAIEEIDSEALKVPAAELFYTLAEKYYNGDDSLSTPAEYDFSNVWFWDGEKQTLMRHEVDRRYFDETDGDAQL